MKRNLLFISRYPEIIDEFQGILEEKQIETDIAQNGTDAMELLKQKEYQILVTDLNLDGYNGDKILSYVNQKFPDTICMLYTNSISAVSCPAALEAGKRGADQNGQSAPALCCIPDSRIKIKPSNRRLPVARFCICISTPVPAPRPHQMRAQRSGSHLEAKKLPVRLRSLAIGGDSCQTGSF